MTRAYSGTAIGGPADGKSWSSDWPDVSVPYYGAPYEMDLTPYGLGVVAGRLEVARYRHDGTNWVYIERSA